MGMTYDKNQTEQQCDRSYKVHIENKTKLSLLIGSGTVYDENQTRKQCDKWYKCGLHRK